MKTFLSNFVAAVALLAAVPGSRAAEAPNADNSMEITPGLLDALLAEAASGNPALAASGARAEAANAAVEAVRTWEDPTATVGLSVPAARGFRSSEEGNLVYGIEQKIPVFHRPQLARDVAAAEAAREKLSLGYQTAQVRRDLNTALIAL